MDSSRRSEAQQFKSITVLRHPVFLGSKPQENGVLGLRRACPTRLANEDGRAVLESNARGFGRMVGKPYFWDYFTFARDPPETGAVCSDRGSHCEDSAEPSLALRNPVVGLRRLCQRIRLDNRLNFSLRYEIKCFVQIFGAVLLAANYSNAFRDKIH